MKKYICTVCGYIHIGNHPPKNCPVCGVSAGNFEVFEQEDVGQKQSAMAWRCLNCEYIHNGIDAPDTCPICAVKSDMFEPYEKDLVYEEKHEVIKVVIIGSGIAGLSCAEEIRNHSTRVDITLISEDTLLPYYRLNLTRYIAKETNRESLKIHPKSFYDEKKIKLIMGVEVSEIIKDNKQVVLNNGEIIKYDKVVIANGAHPFVPPIVGKDIRNVVTVRNLEDADNIIEKAQKIGSCICIGGGILGLETAAAIAKRVSKVTLLEVSEWLMPRQLNKKAAGILKKYLKNIGVEVKENIKVQEIIGKEICEGVKLSSGDVLPGELVIITTGIRPNIHLARKANLETNMGVIVNNHMQTSEKDIFAAGDVSEHLGVLYGLWNVAQFQGKIAAQSVLGINTQFGGVPKSNILKVLGLDMFSIGEFIPKDKGCYQLEEETPEKYILFVFKDERIIGSIIIGDQSLAIQVKKAVEKKEIFPRSSYDSVESIVARLQG